MQFQTAMLASAAVASMHDHRLDERPNRVARYRFCTARAERPVSGLEDEFGFERRLTGVPEEGRPAVGAGSTNRRDRGPTVIARLADSDLFCISADRKGVPRLGRVFCRKASASAVSAATELSGMLPAESSISRRGDGLSASSDSAPAAAWSMAALHAVASDPRRPSLVTAMQNTRSQSGLLISASRMWIPTKPPPRSEKIAPPYSEMMSPPRRWGLTGSDGCCFVRGRRQAAESVFNRRMLSPSRFNRWALCTRRSRIASA